MDALELAHRYFAAWNRRDAGAVLETISPGGTYRDPATPGPLAHEHRIHAWLASDRWCRARARDRRAASGEQGITSVTGYFDAALVPRQLGLGVIVQPKEVGPVRFGVASAVRRGTLADAGTLVVTELVAHTDEGGPFSSAPSLPREPAVIWIACGGERLQGRPSSTDRPSGSEVPMIRAPRYWGDA